jgi:HPt (histidine-containing phosphotransfer) domain-containing protein
MNSKNMATELGLEYEEFLELVELFMLTAKNDIATLEAACQAHQAEIMAEAAHSLKGAASNLGFTELYLTARTIEEKARGNHLNGIHTAVESLKHALSSINSQA